MANQYFVFRELPELDETFEITDKSAVHHIFTVMRAQENDELRLVFDGGKIGLCQVVSNELHTVKLLSNLTENTELPAEITIAVGFPKGDKLDFITEKSTELGARQIWAAPFKWSVAKWDSKKLAKKAEKLSKIALGAAEQSRRLVIPEVQLFEKLSNLTDRFSEFDHVLIAYEESAKSGETSELMRTLAKNPSKILLIFGPEGGISPEEIEKFEQLGAISIGLGPRILRAETAPLYALSAISSYYDLMN